METRTSDERHAFLRADLVHLRDETQTKIARFLRDQREESQPTPGDEMDAARSSADIERSASLVERSEERVRLIDEALAGLDAGTYGICAECGDEIPAERLQILPFAILCVDCQSKRKQVRSFGGASWADSFDEGPRATPEHGNESRGAGARKAARAASPIAAVRPKEAAPEPVRPRRGPRKLRAKGS